MGKIIMETRGVGSVIFPSGSSAGGTEVKIIYALAEDEDDEGNNVCEVGAVTLRFRIWIGPRPNGGVEEVGLTLYGDDLDKLSEVLAFCQVDTDGR